MPGTDESYRYCEVGLSQQVCTVLSETSSRLGKTWEVLVPIIMYCNYGKGMPEIKEYQAEFKHEGAWCAEEKRN
jgi:hypothetical protein